MNVIEYVKQHKHINYCEAIITKDGAIFDAVPSHIEKLISLSDKSKMELNNLMPISCSPLEWLLGYTECVAVWYNSFIFDKLTQAQINTLKYLSRNNVLSVCAIGNNTDEYERCKIIDDFINGRCDSIPVKEERLIKLIRGRFIEHNTSN